VWGGNQLLADLWQYSLDVLNRSHTDPNLGNYLFNDDGTLGLLDFGCIKKVDPQLQQQGRSLVREFLTGDIDRCMEGWRKL